MQIKRSVAVVLFILSLLSVSSGCSDNTMYEQQVSKVELYNKGVENTERLFAENERIARANEDKVVDMITCNKIDKEGYQLLNITDKPERKADSDEMYMYQCMSTLMTKTIIDTYSEYFDYSNNLSTFTNSEGEFIYKYGNAYVIDSGYYASVSSKYLCQFLVIDNSSGSLLKARVFWSGGKIQEIVIQ